MPSSLIEILCAMYCNPLYRIKIILYDEGVFNEFSNMIQSKCPDLNTNNTKYEDALKCEFLN